MRKLHKGLIYIKLNKLNNEIAKLYNSDDTLDSLADLHKVEALQAEKDVLYKQLDYIAKRDKKDT